MMFMWTAIRLAGQNAQLKRELRRRDEQIDGLCTRLRRIQDDVELLALAVPRAKRRDALALVRDRHRIENGEIIEEATR